jgi:hypothetical protein
VVVTVLLALRFVLELCLLGSMAVIGLAAFENAAAGILTAATLVAAVGALWGALLSPRRPVDLPLPLRVVIEIVLFVIAGFGLAVSGHPSAGVVLVIAELVLLPGLAALGHPPGQGP